MRSCSSYLLLLSFHGSEVKRWSIPKSKLGKVFFIWIPYYLYLRLTLPALKWLQIVPGKHGKRDVTTVFAHSHLNTLIDQWECAYCLKYFIKLDRNTVHVFYFLIIGIDWYRSIDDQSITTQKSVIDWHRLEQDTDVTHVTCPIIHHF